MNKIIIGLLFTVSCCLYAQKDSKRLSNSFVSFDLTSPVFNTVPRFGVGYYKSLNQKILIGGDFELGFEGLFSNHLIQENYFSFAVKPEIIFTLPSFYKTHCWFSANMFYIYQSQKMYNGSFYSLEQLRTYHYESTDYLRFKYGANTNLNIIFKLSNKLRLQLKTGIGVKIRNVTFKNVVLNEPEFNWDDDIFGTQNYLNEAGQKVKPNLDFNISLIYLLIKSQKVIP